jgi:hypothetical protein
MSKFKWLAVLCIVLLLLTPIGILFLPSWSSKLTPMLNLVSTLMGGNAGNKMALGSFSFVGNDADAMTLRIDLAINNTEGQDMLFPSVNLTFNYGSEKLGDGWVNPAVFIPAGAITPVPIYARMQKGDAFNKFLVSLIAGGLSLSISGGQAFVFMDTFGGLSNKGVMTIPLPSIPLPSISLGGATFWPPTIHKVFQGVVTAGVPVNIIANVTDRGGGVKTVILSWNNGSGWVNTTMTGLPMKPIFGGTGTPFGALVKPAFPVYPDSPILTACPGVFGIVNATIPGQPVDTPVQYRLYVIDDFEYVTLVPSTPPTYTVGSNTTLNLMTNIFNYTVSGTPSSNFTAVWLPVSGGAGETSGLADMLNSLSANGIDIFGAIMAGSNILGSLSISNLLELILPLITYFQERGVNPFEIVDQLLGLAGGDKITSNSSVALDMLSEGGISLIDLVNALDVNFTKVVTSLANSIRPPIEGYSTISAGVFDLLNKTFWDPMKNATFFNFLDANDLYYLDKPLLILKNNRTDNTWTNFTAQSTPFIIEGNGSVSYYFGSPLPGESFTILDVNCALPANPSIYGKYQWSYSPDSSNWVSLPVLRDETANFTKSGRIFFNITGSDLKEIDVDGTKTMWVQLEFLAAINGTEGPTVSTMHLSHDYVPYYFNSINVDMAGRPNTEMKIGEMDSFVNLMRSLNKTPSYGMVIWGLLSYRGINYSYFVRDLIGGELMTIEGPVTGVQIVTTTSPMLGLIVYGILLLGVLAAIRGRKGAYAISPLRVKKWYDSAIVTPSLKGREEIEKYKMK